MGTFQRKTLRNLTPLAREVAEAINECDAVKRRLIRLLSSMMSTELQAQALQRRFPVEADAIRLADKQRKEKRHNTAGRTLTELFNDFHDPAPIERQALKRLDRG